MTEDGCDTLMVEGEVVINGSSTDGENDAKTTSPASSTDFLILFLAFTALLWFLTCCCFSFLLRWLIAWVHCDCCPYTQLGLNCYHFACFEGAAFLSTQLGQGLNILFSIVSRRTIIDVLHKGLVHCLQELCTTTIVQLGDAAFIQYFPTCSCRLNGTYDSELNLVV